MILIPLFLPFLLVPCSGYIFQCLDKCECDTEDEVIHCHNGERTTIALPEGGRLRGFNVIGITHNQIENLPNEVDLLEKFPDLIAIDVERNERFNCSSLMEYNKIKIISDCYKTVITDDDTLFLLRPTKECDVSCFAKKHYDELHKYVLKLWEMIKDKYQNFDKDEVLHQIKTFFLESFQSIKSSINTGIDKYHPRNLMKNSD